MAQRDDGLDKLEAFIAMLGETQSNFQQSADRLDKLEDELGKQEDDAQEKIGALSTEIHEFTESFVSKHQEALGGLDEMIQSLTTIVDDRLGEAIKTIEEIEKTVEDAVDTFEQALQSTFDSSAMPSASWYAKSPRATRSVSKGAGHFRWTSSIGDQPSTNPMM